MEVHTQRPCHPAVVSKDMMLIRDFGNNLANQLQIVEEWSWSHRKPGHSQIFRRERERSHAATRRASLSQPSLYLYLVHQQFCTQLSCSSRSLSWRWATGDGALWTLYPTSSNSSPKLRSAQVKRREIQESTCLLNYKITQSLVILMMHITMHASFLMPMLYH